MFVVIETNYTILILPLCREGVWFPTQKDFTYTIEHVIIPTITKYIGIQASHVPSQSLTESMHRRLRVQQTKQEAGTPRQPVLSK
jgi:hypothetical protein